MILKVFIIMMEKQISEYHLLTLKKMEVIHHKISDKLNKKYINKIKNTVN